MTQVLDYSAGTPGAKAIKAAGFVGAVRYAGTPGRRKNLTAAEFADLDRGGLAVATVYENKAGDFLGGRVDGQRAGHDWLADVSSIDGRLARVGHFAVDTDVTNQWTALAEYFRGINSVIGVERTRAYGEADVIDYLVAHGLVSGLQWQTVAWSRGRRSQYAALYQRTQQPVVGGIACDINDVLAPDWGQHTYEEDDVSFLTDIAKDPGGGKWGWHIMHASKMADILQKQLVATQAAVAADKDVTPEQLAQIVDAAVAKHQPTPDEIRAAVLPGLEEAMREVLGDDNANQADAIVTALTERLQQGANS
jgi:hypothetical protein